MISRPSTAIAVLAIVAAGCSSGEGDSEPSVVASPATTASSTASSTPSPASVTATTLPAPTTPPSTTEASAAPVPTTAPPTTLSLIEADQALARSALLTLDAFPDGWTAVPAEPDEGDDDADEFQDEFDACLTIDGDERVADQLEDVQVISDTFSSDGLNQPEVEHKVAMVADDATAVVAMAELAADGAPACIQGVLQVFFVQAVENDPETPEGLTIGTVTVERADDASIPDTRLGYTVAVPFEIDDEAATQYLHIWYQRQGRALSNLQMSSFGTPFDAAGIDALTSTIESALAMIGN